MNNLVISACAGSGKTYALIQRLLQLLKEGQAPGEILVITFTRKAAAEIEHRLFESLQACADNQESWARHCLRRLLLAEHSADELNIHTFHSWFSVLLSGRHWSRQWHGPADIIDDESPLCTEAWQRWLAEVERQPPPELASVLAVCSPEALRKLLTERLVHHSNAWRLYLSKPPSPAEAEAGAESDTEPLQAALEALFSAAQARSQGASAEKAYAAATDYLQTPDQETLAQLEKAFLKKTDGKIPQRLAAAFEKNNQRHLLSRVEQALNDCLEADSRRQTLKFHRDFCVLARAYFEQLKAAKTRHNQMSFNDLEYEGYCAVREHGDVNSMLYRINKRFRHILIDEFQDTSPLQWQIIARWLEAAHGDSAIAPSVFIVGDAKQAIYRFRHGDARLLEEAKQFLHDYYHAEHQENNTCRRLAPPLLQLVNALFPQLLPGFVTHHPAAENAHLPGRVEWRPLEFAAPHSPESPQRMRNPLLTAIAEDSKEHLWAQSVAQGVRTVMDTWCISEDGHRRAVKEEDILLLLPQMTHASLLNEALLKQGIACSMHGGKMRFADVLACQDMIALMTVLLAPENSLSLAQVLKSPLFALPEAALLEIAVKIREDQKNLWQCLIASELPLAKQAATVLQRWRRWALDGRLPVHDLLVRIFDDGRVYARYRASVAESYRCRVAADLSALLDFSLAYEGGRQPLLRQFIQALSTHSPPKTADATGVRLMTVHGTKGLQAPIVILASCGFSKYHSAGGKDSVDILIDWPPSAEIPQHFIFRPKAQGRAYRALVEEEEKQAEHEYNNLFYVALTRAKQGLLIYSQADKSNPRLQRLSEVMQAQATRQADGSWVLGDDLTDATVTPCAQPAITPPALPALEVGSRVDAIAARRGIVLHRLMALLLQGFHEDEIKKLTFVAEVKLLAEAQKLLATQELRRLLQDSEHYAVEAEFIHAGQILRLDLLIFTADEIWIIDYKTGGHDWERYAPQMQRYLQAVAAVYPDKPVYGAFVTARGFHRYEASA